ncbi:GIY-YIG nuclease family protein [Paenibacillus alvei]|uniref:GIY-YIG nuclease family protein n=1 Tax=Paenibacillus alvei TaxID=44250 RepID=UPI0018CDA467|nr:hypothetical protein [Paenibacillus alvei]MCY9580709.1 hypothetical protein [Paenibacillus alvei]MCY9585192.1 hypothetical protein [Paenibacillus alvei]
MIQNILEVFETNIFDPCSHVPKQLPNNKGLYMITANNLNILPKMMRELKYNYMLGRPIIYVGISNKSLRARDYRNHFKGSARGSTLRKSLGSLMHLTKLREKQCPSKYKFVRSDEDKLSQWMKNNLFLHYLVFEAPDEVEKTLINEINPPLNLKNNNNKINIEFRRALKELRK